MTTKLTDQKEIDWFKNLKEYVNTGKIDINADVDSEKGRPILFHLLEAFKKGEISQSLIMNTIELGADVHATYKIKNKSGNKIEVSALSLMLNQSNKGYDSYDELIVESTIKETSKQDVSLDNSNNQNNSDQVTNILFSLDKLKAQTAKVPQQEKEASLKSNPTRPSLK